MDEPADTSENRAPVDDPLEMRSAEATKTIGWHLHLRRRFLHHHRRLADGADPLDVDMACVLELLQFAGRDRVLRTLSLPSGAFVRALADMKDGGDPAYFKRRKRQRSALTSRQHFIGNAAHLVETLVAGKAFTVTAAAREVAAAFNAADFPPPKKRGSRFTERLVEDWHAFVVHKAKRTDPARDLFEKQQETLGRVHPDHMQWGTERLKEWLADSVRDMARQGYFVPKPG